jgi:hypothetical protein
MSDKCTACRREPLWTNNERATQLCATCASVLGVVAMPPPRRKFAPCRCCGGTSFIRAIQRPPHGSVTKDQHRAYGELEMYVCRGCGYIDWYCNDLESVPIGPQYMTELVEGESAGPYR